MNLLFTILMEYQPNEGGVQRSTYKLANHFAGSGFKVTVLCLTAGKNRVENGIRIRYLPSEKEYSETENRKAIKIHLRENNYDIIINQMGYDDLLTKILDEYRQSHCKIINAIRINPIHFLQHYREILRPKLHPYWLFNNPITWYAVEKIHKYKQKRTLKGVFDHCDKVVLLSDSFKKEVRLFYPGVKDEQLEAIPNPFLVPDGTFSNNNKENVILFVGRINIQQKRIDLLLEIWRSVKSKLPGWELWIVGDGPKREFLKSEIQKEDDQRVKYFGYQDPEPYYKKASILAFTSAYEGFGNVLIEGQSYGVVPVLFNSYAAASEIIEDQKNGFLIKPFEVEDYCQTIIELANNKKMRLKMAEEALQNAKRYDINEIGKKWISLFEQVRND